MFDAMSNTAEIKFAYLLAKCGKKVPGKKIPDIGMISRWPINNICHSVVFRYCAIVFFFAIKTIIARGVQRKSFSRPLFRLGS